MSKPETQADVERSVKLTKDWDRGRGACDCVARANRQLESNLSGLGVENYIDQTTGEQFVAVSLIRDDAPPASKDKSRQKIREPFLANYCPFCGRKYDRAEANGVRIFNAAPHTLSERRRFEFECRIVPDNGIPAFAAYLAGQEIDPVPEIRINFNALLAMCLEHGFDWREELSDTVVHELLHIVQHKFGMAFDELQIDDAIEEARLLDTQACQDRQDLLIGRAAREAAPKYTENQELEAVIFDAARTIIGAAHRQNASHKDLSLNSGKLGGESIGNWRIVVDRQVTTDL